MIKLKALMAVFRKRDFLAVSYPLMLSVMLAVSIYLRHVALTILSV